MQLLLELFRVFYRLKILQYISDKLFWNNIFSIILSW